MAIITFPPTSSGGGVSSVSATAPVTSSGGATPTIATPAATTSVNGYLTSADWNTFNGKSNTTGTVTSVTATPGTGISITGSPITTSGTLVVTNTAPDQTVAFTNGTGISVTGTYPNFTVTNTSPSSGGTVTSVSGTAPVVSSGGATPAISMAKATTLVDGYLAATDFTTFNNKGSGTVTSVAALTLGTTGTDLSSTVATGTTTPVITLQVPTASAANRGALSSTDWSTFNGKQAALVSATNIKTINGASVLGSGDLVVTGSFTGGTLTSQLKLATGTASAGAAPLKFVAGPVNTAAESGAMEYDGNAFYSSVANSTRGVMPTEQWVVLTGTNTLTSQTAVQPIFDGGGGPTNGQVTLPIGTYEYELSFALTGMSATSGSFGFGLGGTATKTFSYQSSSSKAGTALTTPMTVLQVFGSAANTVLQTASTGTVGTALIKGIMRVTVAGTVIPQISLTTAAAAVIQANSYFKISPLGNATVATVGNWA